MNEFPTLPDPKLGIRQEVVLEQVRTTFEGGYVQSRPRYTRARRRWNLEWDADVALSETDYATLEAFFIANQGLDFIWTHPITGTSYTCRFTEDQIESNYVAAGFIAVRCPIEEV